MTFYVQYDATGTIVGSGFCPSEDFSRQIVPVGGGIAQTDKQIHGPEWSSYKVVNGALTPVG